MSPANATPVEAILTCRLLLFVETMPQDSRLFEVNSQTQQTFLIGIDQDTLRLRMAVVGGEHKVLDGQRLVFLDAFAFRIHFTEAVLRTAHLSVPGPPKPDTI
jgi:hypothetical protein